MSGEKGRKAKRQEGEEKRGILGEIEKGIARGGEVRWVK